MDFSNFFVGEHSWCCTDCHRLSLKPRSFRNQMLSLAWPSGKGNK